MRKIFVLIVFTLLGTVTTRESNIPQPEKLPEDIFWIGRFTCEQYEGRWIAYDSTHVSKSYSRPINAINEVITMSN